MIDTIFQIHNKTCLLKPFAVYTNQVFLVAKDDEDSSSDDDDLSDTDYPDQKTSRVDNDDISDQRDLIIERSLQNNVPALGEWEKHTRVSMYSFVIFV